MGNILLPDNAVFHDLRNAGNGGQRRFQLVGDIGSKLPPVLFLLLTLCHIQYQNHCAQKILGVLRIRDSVGNDLIDTLAHLKPLLGVSALPCVFHRLPKFLAPIHSKHVFHGCRIGDAKNPHGTLVIGEQLIVAVNHQKSLAHVLGNHRELLLLLANLRHLCVDLLILHGDALQERRKLLIGVHLLRML